jgi:hypothetical protein
MYDTPFRSYDAQLGRFHKIDPLADLAPGINPYRFGFNNPISMNDPTGLYEGSIQDIFDEAWARTSGDVGYFNFNNGSLNRDTSTENDINWVVDFVTSGQGTAEYMMDSSGGGFWLHYNPSFVGGYVGSRNEHVGAIIQKRSLFFRLGAQNGGQAQAGIINGDYTLNDVVNYGLGTTGLVLNHVSGTLINERAAIVAGKYSRDAVQSVKLIDKSLDGLSRASRKFGVAGLFISGGSAAYNYAYGDGITASQAFDFAVTGALTLLTVTNPVLLVVFGVYGVLDAVGAFNGIKESLGGNSVILKRN